MLKKSMKNWSWRGLGGLLGALGGQDGPLRLKKAAVGSRPAIPLPFRQPADPAYLFRTFSHPVLFSTGFWRPFGHSRYCAAFAR